MENVLKILVPTVFLFAFVAVGRSQSKDEPAIEVPPTYFELGDFETSVRFVAFSPDSGRIATTGPDSLIRIWEVESGKALRKLDAVAGEDRRIGGLTRPPKLVAGDFSPDWKRLATVSSDDVIRIWDVDSGKVMQTFAGHDKSDKTALILSIVFSPDGRKIATASWDGTARIWDAGSGKELRKLVHTDARLQPNRVNSATFSPDGKRLLTHTQADTIIRIWDVDTGEILREWKGHPYFVVSALFTPDGKKVISVGDAADGVVIWDADSGKELHRLEHGHHFGKAPVVSLDGKKIVTVTGAPETAVRIWDIDSGKVLQTLKEHDGGGYAMLSAALSPDGKTIVTTSNHGSGMVRIWDVGSGKSLQTLDGHHYQLFSAVFSPDGRKIAVTSGDADHGEIIAAKIWILKP